MFTKELLNQIRKVNKSTNLFNKNAYSHQSRKFSVSITDSINQPKLINHVPINHFSFVSNSSRFKNYQQERLLSNDNCNDPDNDLKQLLKRKHLKTTIFSDNPSSISLSNDITDHVAWAFENIYSVPYKPQFQPEDERVARYHHGIQHVSRAALYVPILANLYRKYGDQEALALNNNLLKLLQIAVIFHDAARENEGEDLWDYDSAELFFYYAIKILKINVNLALEIATAIAHKDKLVNKKLIIKESGMISWKDIERDNAFRSMINWKGIGRDNAFKSIYQKLIHDADCLDIIRVHPGFDARYLDFFKDIAIFSKSALEEMAYLISQVKGLIFWQGDKLNFSQSLKRQYERTRAYELHLYDLQNNRFISLNSFFAQGMLLSGKKLSRLTFIDPNNMLHKNRVFARSIPIPSAISLTSQQKQGRKPIETLAECEFRKVKRRKGVLTSTSKENGLEKMGNPNRSISLLKYGATVFYDVGCLIFNYDPNSIKAIFSHNIGSGFQKKNELKTILSGYHYSLSLEALEKKLQFAGHRNYGNHNEILYDVTCYDAIYYTVEATCASAQLTNNPYPLPYSSILKALYIQYEYKQAFNGKIIPIYEYSGNFNYLKETKPLSDEKIIKLWKDMCTTYMKGEIDKGNAYEIKHYDIETLLVHCSYGKLVKTPLYHEVRSLDLKYPQYLKNEIREKITALREQIIHKHEQDREERWRRVFGY